jgi:hypothetical protein
MVVAGAAETAVEPGDELIAPKRPSAGIHDKSITRDGRAKIGECSFRYTNGGSEVTK